MTDEGAQEGHVYRNTERERSQVSRGRLFRCGKGNRDLVGDLAPSGPDGVRDGKPWRREKPGPLQ